MGGTLIGAAVTLNTPGRYLHWSIFTVSEANLVLIAVMVVIFGLALTVPFPTGRHGVTDQPPEATQAVTEPIATADDEASSQWTSRVRRFGLRFLPPGKLLPDRQPAYVSSWVYVFGVASLAALGLAILSGLLIAVGGPDWWHTDPVGHFFNSMHMWSVELFMALLVIHLWGKFWMAAWRGRRKATWITGVVAFLASVVECFTGYLSQQNFDSQWISTSGKDAFNAAGVGAFFNPLNFGEMLLWHVVLLPIVLIVIVGAHVLLVRVRGVSHPLPARRPRGRAARRAAAVADAAEWRGPTRRYDIVKEGVAAVVVASLLVVLLAGLLSSPDVPAVTISNWAKVAPADFMATAASELAGTSETATYGPPFNHQSGSVQQLWFSPQRIVGVRIPVTAAATFVLGPLTKGSPGDPVVRTALARYRGAPSGEQGRWDQAYLKAVQKVHFTPAGVPFVPPAGDGPVPAMIAGELAMARSGALDADLLAQQPFYGTNFTKPLLFLEDGEYFIEQATKAHLSGTQWGVMNETGGYPGQPWLWLYTLWYQVPGFDNSANVDLIAVYLTGAATLLLLAVPFVPGLRDVPSLVPVHRLIWRGWGGRRKAGGAPDPIATTEASAVTPGGTEVFGEGPPGET
jgi:hypothetical protein